MNGKPFYRNGFNAYWMMYMASDPSTRDKVTSAFQQASKYGMNVARTWGFNDGGTDTPLPTSPGSYNEDTFKQWVKEMAAHVKSIDSQHLLEIGLEGFYRQTTPDKKQFNPGNQEYGSDFIASNLLPEIDFSTIHIYAEQWLSGSSEEAQDAFVDKWVQEHIQDSNTVNDIYNSASTGGGGSCVGGLFWLLMAQGMENFGDGYEVVLEESPTTANVIDQQSRKLGGL
ncbi:hypothetical protein C1H46_021526 [Malus baccata]|uniref:mannan endo-1,4-beta-mannosidase n=1 Tax=Malus baccata TaxID=106549 RepID=A0A540M2D5_MALBA|nr:hypothetical protein C1H46_021526 [Malus baccata]